MTSGTEPGLLLLHALPFDAEMWSAQMSLLPDQTYVPNLYDFGSNIEVWAKMSLNLVPEPNLVVVGCSVGGSCAIEVARIAPSRIAALVLIGTKARHDPDPVLYANSSKMLKEHGVEAAWEHYWEPLFMKGRDDLIARSAKRIALRQPIDSLENGLAAFHNRPNRQEVIKHFNFPIHVVTGDEDRFPGLQYSQQLSKSAQNGQLHIIESSGHYVPMVRPQELNTLLKGIISAHSG